MESSLERAERLVAAAVDVPLMIAYRMHTEPAVRRGRELIAEGAIGDPTHVHENMSQPLLELILDPGHGDSIRTLSATAPQSWISAYIR